MAFFRDRSLVNRFLFAPPRWKNPPDEDTRRAFRIQQETNIPYVFERNPESKGKSAVYFHGNGTNILKELPLVKTLARVLKRNVYAFEYAGYFPTLAVKGSSLSSSTLPKGKKKQLGPTQDRVEALIIEAFRAQFSHTDDLLLVGHSLGCAVAIHVATLLPVKHLILMAPFLSLRHLLKDLGILPFLLLLNRFDNTERLPRVQVSGNIEIFHGESDALIPSTHGYTLAQTYSKSRARFHLMKGVDHSPTREEWDGVLGLIVDDLL